MKDNDLYSGLIRLHILHHAGEGPIFGLEIIEELGRHGYKLSPGTIYLPSCIEWRRRGISDLKLKRHAVTIAGSIRSPQKEKKL